MNGTMDLATTVALQFKPEHRAEAWLALRGRDGMCEEDMRRWATVICQRRRIDAWRRGRRGRRIGKKLARGMRMAYHDRPIEEQDQIGDTARMMALRWVPSSAGLALCLGIPRRTVLSRHHAEMIALRKRRKWDAA